MKSENLALEKPMIKVLIFKYLKKIRKFKHSEIIKFMILNNSAQYLYLNNKIDTIKSFHIMNRITKNKNEKIFKIIQVF